MCGISGFYVSKRFELDDQTLCSFNQCLVSRGPDDSGIFKDPIDGCIGLAHTRLAIQDLSPLGHQPMIGLDGSVALIFNGEIYNFQDLRSELEANGFCFSGHSDTEVILQLYLFCRRTRADFSSMLHRLNGIFALALWDADRNELLLARDALGVKPLYYAATDHGLFFSSELKALIPPLSSLPVQSSKPVLALDIPALERYLTYLWCPGNQTPLTSIKKLGPGQFLSVRKGQIHKQITWYQLPVFRSDLLPSRKFLSLSEKDPVGQMEFHLRQAVQRQMVADVPVGAFLSGGLDSSSIVTFAREINPDLRCFTIDIVGGKEEGFADDLPYAHRVAQHLEVPLDVVTVDAPRMAALLPAMVAQLDEPLADPAPLNVLFICQHAREKGIKVLLSGAGGDDLFSGYRRHLALYYEALWSWLPQRWRYRLARRLQQLPQALPLGRRLSRLGRSVALSGDARLVEYFRWLPRPDLEVLYSSSFRAELRDVKTTAESPLLEFLADLPPSTSPLERMLALEQRFFLTDHNLLYTDKMSMAVGVEVRVPFLDLELVEFSASLSGFYKQRGTTNKFILRKAMRSYLPQDVIYRPKAGFGAPLRRWMRHDLRGMVGELLSESSLRSRGLFDPVAVQRLVAANDRAEQDASYTLLSLICIELWCRHFLDGVPVAPFQPSER
jgi:asparagine synthase (glutamine-hydrolysing)